MKTVIRVVFILFALSFFSTKGGFAQVLIEREVVGSSGSSIPLNGNVLLEQTIGEPTISTLEADNFTLTQGFHQPLSGSGFLAFSVETVPSSCPTSSDGSAVLSAISGCTPPYEIIWSNGVLDTDSLERLLPGLYSVTVRSGFCQETVEFEVRPGPAAACELRIFNAFTPGGDGKSDTWQIENIDLDDFKENRLEVFNRWGQVVYSARDYNNLDVVWDGSSSTGIQLLTGTYFYVLETNGTTFKGYVELIR